MLRTDSDGASELNSFKIRWPVVIFFTIGMVVIHGFILASNWWLSERVQSDLLGEEIHRVGLHIKQVLDQEKEDIYEHLTLISKMESLSDAFLAQDRQQLMVKSQPVMDVLKELELRRWVFYKPDLTNFLRVHRPGKFDDQSKSPVVVQAQRTGQFSFGMEAGRTGVPTFRGVIPWQVNGATIGYLELNKEVVHFVKKLQDSTGVQMYTFFHKDYLDKEDFSKGLKELDLDADWQIHPDLVSVIQAGGQIPPAVKHYLQQDLWQKEIFQQTASIITHPYGQGEESLLFFTLPVQDANKKTVMRVVVLWENGYLHEMFDLQSFMLSKLAIVLTLLLCWIFYYYLGKVEGRIWQAAGHLKEVKESLTKAQDIANLGNWAWRPDKTPTLTWSPEIPRILGYQEPGATLSPDTLLSLLREEDQTLVRQGFHRFMAGKEEKFEWEFRLKNQGGEGRAIYLRADAQWDSASSIPRVVFGTLQDVTRQKQLEHMARNNAIFLQNTLESAQEGILLTDGKGNITYCNGKLLAMWNMSGKLPRQKMQEKIVASIELQLEDANTFHHQMKRYIDSKEVGEDLLRLKDGRFVECHTYPIMGETQLLGRGWRFVDITQHYLAGRREERAMQSRLAISALLETGLEPLELSYQLHVALEIILSVPWLAILYKGSIFLVDEHGSNDLLMATQIGLHPNLLTTCARIPQGHCLCGRAAALREIVFAPHLDDRHDIRFQGMVPHGHYCVPILSRTALLGVINLYVADGHQRNPEEDAFLGTVANLLAGLIEARRTAPRLAEEQELTATILRAVPALVMVLNPSGGIVLFSRACQLLTGLTEEEVLEQKIWQLPFAQADGIAVQQVFQRLLTENLPSITATHWLDQQGESRRIQWRYTVVRHADNTIRNVVVSALDEKETPLEE